MRTRTALGLSAAAAAVLVAASTALAQAPPGQPQKGPGGSGLPFQRATPLLHDSAAGDQFD